MTRRIRTACLLALLGSLVAARATSAQDVPVVFIHGIFANGDEWRRTSARLANILQITPYVVDLPSTATLNTQTAALDGAMHSLPSNTIAIGHSQGGLIARQWHRSKALSGVLTLGTPHQGALLSQRGLDLIKFHGVLYNLAGLAISYGSTSEFSWIFGAIYQAVANTQLLSWYIGQYLVGTTAVVNYVPVAPQLVPNSAFLNDLNSFGNLSRERGTNAKRVSLVYTADQYWRAGAAVGLAPDSREWAWQVQQASPPLLELGAAWLDANYPPTHFLARVFASRLRELAGYVRDMDAQWCWAVTDNRQCLMPHDGIVSIASQGFPGGTSYAVYGPAHTQERRQSDSAIAGVLKTEMGVRERGAAVPPPSTPPPSSGADILGPDRTLRPDQQIRSANGQYRLLYQWDGNLVLYGPSGAVWASDTADTSPGFVAMQGDGNFVIYDSSGEAVWSSDTFEPNSYLRVHDEGYIMVRNPSGVGLWWSGSGGL